MVNGGGIVEAEGEWTRVEVGEWIVNRFVDGGGRMVEIVERGFWWPERRTVVMARGRRVDGG